MSIFGPIFGDFRSDFRRFSAQFSAIFGPIFGDFMAVSDNFRHVFRLLLTSSHVVNRGDIGRPCSAVLEAVSSEAWSGLTSVQTGT